MTTKLLQKHLLKGTQEFEICDDHVKMRIKEHFKGEESLSVMLTVINPEPVITKSTLDFTSRVNSEPLISLYLGKPSTEKFNAFVSELKQKALEEYNAFAGLKHPGLANGLGANSFEEPPEFSDELKPNRTKTLDPVKIEDSIQLLKDNLEFTDSTPLVAALDALKTEPGNESLQLGVMQAFNDLGVEQGAVLTYAPYVGILMYDDPFS